MKSIFIVYVLIVICTISWALPIDDEKCEADKNCKLPNCRCYGQDITLDQAKIPQIVLISSDDAITVENYKTWSKLYFSRKNPNNCTIGVTFFVPHEYTDYEKVHALYSKGFEIAVNSITKEYRQEYWQEATVELLTKEFKGQKQIITKFGKVDEGDVRGERTPLLQINGDNTFTALENANLTYDNTWTSVELSEWPYSLDFQSEQSCLIGSCPQKAHKGKWVIPVIDWIDTENLPCATVQGCINRPKDDVDAILEWLKLNFNRTYKGNKIPFNMIINSGLFTAQKNFVAAYTKFLDYLATLKDVFIVNHWQALQWIQNPKEYTNKDVFPCIAEKPHNEKTAKTCKLEKEKDDFRYMTIYNQGCPLKYPWLDNPSGN